MACMDQARRLPLIEDDRFFLACQLAPFSFPWFIAAPMYDVRRIFPAISTISIGGASFLSFLGFLPLCHFLFPSFLPLPPRLACLMLTVAKKKKRKETKNVSHLSSKKFFETHSRALC